MIELDALEDAFDRGLSSERRSCAGGVRAWARLDVPRIMVPRQGRQLASRRVPKQSLHGLGRALSQLTDGGDADLGEPRLGGGRRARQLCPGLVFVGGHFDEYQRLGDAAIGVLSDFTPAIERISIDEAFADVAGCTHLFGWPADIARTVRARVRAELGLPMSIGVARTKHLAKIASQVAKPDGLVIVDSETELEFLHELPVAPMWGVGPRHAASHAEGARFVRGRENDAAADRNRLAAQARVKQLFDRRIKGIEMRVENGGCGTHLVASWLLMGEGISD